MRFLVLDAVPPSSILVFPRTMVTNEFSTPCHAQKCPVILPQYPLLVVFGLHTAKMSRPGIEPGSVQPQCTILTTVRSRPTSARHIAVHDPYTHHFLQNHLSSSIISLSNNASSTYYTLMHPTLCMQHPSLHISFVINFHYPYHRYHQSTIIHIFRFSKNIVN